MKLFDKDWWKQQLHKEHIVKLDELIINKPEPDLDRQQWNKLYNELLPLVEHNKFQSMDDVENSFQEILEQIHKEDGTSIYDTNAYDDTHFYKAHDRFTLIYKCDYNDLYSFFNGLKLYKNETEINELNVNNPNKPKVGEKYDVKVWWVGDHWKINDYLQKIYEPTDGTVGGAEGWYWSKGWECISIPNSNNVAFEDEESGERYPYENEKFRPSTLNELQINKPNITWEELYKYCEENIISNDNAFDMNSKGWREYVEITKKYSNNSEFILFRKDFEYLTPIQCNKLYKELQQLVQKYTNNINELSVNKPKQYIPIIKPTKPEYITSAENFKKLTNYFENTNLKLQKEIGRLNIDSVNEIGGIQLPLTIDKASKTILARWFFENVSNYYIIRDFHILDKWWNESKICLEDLERKNINELQINNPNITAKEVEIYYWDNIFDVEQNGIEIWSEYKQLCKPYIEKYDLIDSISSNEFKLLSQPDLNKIYREMKQLVHKYSNNINELQINKPLKFPIKIPKQWNEKTVNNEKELISLFTDFANENPNLFKYIDLEYIIELEKHNNANVYPLSPILMLHECICEGIWYYYQLSYEGGFDVLWMSFKNLITKQFDKRFIDFNEIESTFNIKKLNELGINNPNKTAEEVYKYYYDNIHMNDVEFGINNKKGWEEYEKLRNKYCHKYNIDYSTYNLTSLLSPSDLNQFYREMKQIVQNHVNMNELSVNRPVRTWDFTKYIPNFNPNDIKIGDKIKIQSYGYNTWERTGNIKITDINKIIDDDIDGLFFYNEETSMGYTAEQLVKINDKKQNLNESKKSIKGSFKEFIKFLQQELPIKEKYNIKLTKDKSKTTSFAYFNPSNNEIVVYIKGRNLMDSFRSLAHEWRHLYQNINNELTNTSGEDGSNHENEANAFAGLVMRKWGKLHPEYYTQLVELQVNNPNPTVKEVYEYYFYNIFDNGVEFNTTTEAWDEYEKLRNKYCNKYDINYYTLGLKILSQQDLNQFYREMKQIVQKHTNINELGINKPVRIWDLMKEGVKFENIQVGDILQFEVNPGPETVRQKVIKKSNSVYMQTQDLDKDGNLKPNAMDQWDVWGIEDNWKKKSIHELEVNKPITIKLPLKIRDPKFYDRISPILEKMGYKWGKQYNYLKPTEVNPWKQRIFNDLDDNNNYIFKVTGLELIDSVNEKKPGKFLQVVGISDNSYLNELNINDPTLTWQKVYDFFDKNINYSFVGEKPDIWLNQWDEFKEFSAPYDEKYPTDDWRKFFQLFTRSDLQGFYTGMKQLVQKYSKLNESQKENEIFSAYHGRYKFDVSKAYDLIKQGDIKTKIKTYQPEVMHFLSHPEFSEANPEKYNQIEIDYNEPLGLIANFKDENDKNELILIDGNHRTRKAVGDKQEGKYIVIYDPNDVNKILTINNEIPKKLFSDDERF